MLRIEPSCSAAHLESILAAFAKFRIECDLNFHTLLDRLYDEGISGQDIAVVSAYWSDTLEQEAQLLRTLGNTVTHIPFAADSAVISAAENDASVRAEDREATA
jgi:hypothetical protein